MEICKALKTNTTLQIIDVSHKNISDYGAVVISEYLKNNNTLQKINMSYNKIPDSEIMINVALHAQTVDIRITR